MSRSTFNPAWSEWAQAAFFLGWDFLRAQGTDNCFEDSYAW